METFLAPVEPISHESLKIPNTGNATYRIEAVKCKDQSKGIFRVEIGPLAAEPSAPLHPFCTVKHFPAQGRYLQYFCEFLIFSLSSEHGQTPGGQLLRR